MLHKHILMRPVNVKNSKFADLALKTLIKNQRFDSINYLPSIRVQKKIFFDFPKRFFFLNPDRRQVVYSLLSKRCFFFFFNFLYPDRRQVVYTVETLVFYQCF